MAPTSQEQPKPPNPLSALQLQLLTMIRESQESGVRIRELQVEHGWSARYDDDRADRFIQYVCRIFHSKRHLLILRRSLGL